MIYLASKSPRRRELLRYFKIPFKVIPSSYEEVTDAKQPHVVCMRHAEGKAIESKAPAKARFILGVDTLVYHEGKILGKPSNYKVAEKMFSRLNGKWHTVYSGIALWDKKRGVVWVDYVKTKVKLKKLAPSAVKSYVREIKALDKAGSYAVQEEPYAVEKMVGSYTNVIGLPMERLSELLDEKTNS